MSRTLPALIATLSLLTWPALAGATSGADFAVGGGGFDRIANVGFAAQSGPNGEDAHGEFTFMVLDRFGFPDTTIDVTCLVVFGNTAMIGGIVRQGTGVAPGEGFLIPVQDNGDPINGISPDLIGPQAFPPAPLPCPPFPTQPLFPLEEGNIVVHDG
jgi:hypothetical protein